MIIKLKDLLFKESYYHKLSDDEVTANADLYFSIGQDDDFTRCKNYCWIFDGNKIIAKKGGTHGTNFTHEVAERDFKGWYDVDKNTISIVFPKRELEKLGDKKPDVDDIPEFLYQKLISKYGKRKPNFIVFENYKQLLKEYSALRGEYWIQDGNAQYCDGDVSDQNHEGIVIDQLKREILNDLGIDSDMEYAPEFSDVKDEIFENIGDELTPEEQELWENDELNEVIISYLKRKGDATIEDKIYYMRGHDNKGKALDSREYGLKYWHWQRLKGNIIQTYTLTSSDLKNITNGLYEAYGEELEETDSDNITNSNPLGEHIFNVEVNSTRSYYVDIPWSVLSKDNPSALNPYRSRY